MIKAFHGIGAYRVERSPVAMKRALDVALSGVEVCASDKAIGPFGFIAFGECRKAFTADVWSKVQDGIRVAEYDAEHTIEYPSHAEWEEFTARARCSRYRAEYCEAWITPVAAVALWVRPTAPRRIIKAAKVMAKYRNLPLIYINDPDEERIYTLDIPVQFGVGDLPLSPLAAALAKAKIAKL